MLRLFDGDNQNKVSLLLDYTNNPRDVADPWYTGNFELVYNQLDTAINNFIYKLRNEEVI